MCGIAVYIGQREASPIIPTIHELDMTDFGHVGWAEAKMVILEFAKICWFRLDSLFS